MQFEELNHTFIFLPANIANAIQPVLRKYMEGINQGQRTRGLKIEVVFYGDLALTGGF